LPFADSSLGGVLVNDDAKLDRLLTEILRRRLGQAGPWPAELHRHIAREARARGMDPLVWLTQAQSNAEDLGSVIAAATVGHTTFFRHPDHFERLRNFAPAAAKRTPLLRVWCAGCSSGEEVWSIALSLEELQVPFQIWATDINAKAIERAQRGLYPARTTGGLPGFAGKLAFRVPDFLRRQVRFHVLALDDVLPSDAPPRFDIIFCRNLLIYLEPAAVKSAWALFVQRSEAWGAVVVSPVESLAHIPAELKRVGPLGWFERGANISPVNAPLPRPRIPSIRAPEPTPPDSVDTLLDRAARELSNDEIAAAEADLRAVLEKRDDAVGWFLLGEALSRRRENTQARIAYARAAKATHAPSNVDLETIRDAARRRAQQLP
jgi:chemotaxis protein methyltransferase CheR